MKKLFIITVSLFFFLFSCKKEPLVIEPKEADTNVQEEGIYPDKLPGTWQGYSLFRNNEELTSGLYYLSAVSMNFKFNTNGTGELSSFLGTQDMTWEIYDNNTKLKTITEDKVISENETIIGETNVYDLKKITTSYLWIEYIDEEEDGNPTYQIRFEK